ncbi:MAG: M3 family oligoendopeptidase [Bacteroidia bacterium]
MLESAAEKKVFLPNDFIPNSWESIEPFLTELDKRVIADVESLKLWLKDRSTLDGLLQENLGWRYIHQTCDTSNEVYRENLEFFINEIEPKLSEFNDRLNRKLLENPFTKELNESSYIVFLRGISTEVALFRQENVPILTELQLLSNEYGRITGKMSIEVNGESMTFQKAANLLKSENRELRKEIYEKINFRRAEDREELEALFDKMIQLRHQVALNAGFENYRDYMFAALGRFDYTVEDCELFHTSIEKYIVPLIDQYDSLRLEKLGYDNLYPWDTEIDVDKKSPLSPFKNSEELIDKTIACFRKVNDSYGDVIELMNQKGHLDLDSRIGKAPGGYNYPLHKTSLPFIFMHATGSLRDMVTMMHEGGHAIHSWLSKDLELNGFKETPSEIAEVASMAMELISMEHWEVFFKDEDELNRAKRYQLEKILTILPWIACIDAFQHWIYTHPSHSREDRKNKWLELSRRFSGKVIDKSLYPDFESYSWHRQLHLFEVPFYYLEYGIAQLGAIGIWRNYKMDPKTGLTKYEKALAEGYTYTLPELYNHAGIEFNFSESYVKELVEFVSLQSASFKN